MGEHLRRQQALLFGSAILLAALVIKPTMAADPSASPSRCALPVDVSDRVGNAQIFDYYLANRNALIGRRDVVWGASAASSPGLYSMKYMTVDRDLDRTHDVAWYEAKGRNDWVVRKCDGTPALEFEDPNAPLDITRADIRDYLYQQAVLPVAKSSRFQAMAVDNISSTNVFGRCGTKQGDRFTRRYSGAQLDASFTRDMESWLRWLVEKVHSEGMCVAGNLWYDEKDILGFRRLAEVLDIVVDEGGFTRKCQPLVKDQQWLLRLQTMHDVAKKKPLIVIDYVCDRSADMTAEALDWSLGNYLLLKGDRTYLAIRPLESEQGPLYDPPQMHVRTGPAQADFQQRSGVFFREFDRAIALVNPSSTTSSEFDLPSAREWHDLRGMKASRRITLPPGTGLVLINPD